MHSGINKAKTCTVHRWESLPERTCFPAKKIKSWKNIKVELCAAEWKLFQRCKPAGTEVWTKTAAQCLFAARQVDSPNQRSPLFT